MISLTEIQRFFEGRIRLSEPLDRYTSFRIGGPADYFLEPTSREELIQLVRYLRTHDVPYFILGRGANIVVSDNGFRGVVINLEQGLSNITVDGNDVFAEAGARLGQLIEVCIEHSLQGSEILAGIPGTVGGAIKMNAGSFGGEISDHLLHVDVLDGDDEVRFQKSAITFGYRYSSLEDVVLLGATFKFPTGDQEELMRRRRETLLKRNESQPMNYASAGGIFKNPHGKRVAVLLDEAGLKGYRCGGAIVSTRHANFIVNTGGATASDVLSLIELMKEKVHKKFDITLELEVELVGFSSVNVSRIYS